LAARKASIPLYKLLGGERDSIQAYASLPFYDSLPAYIKAVNDYSKLGLLTFKFHAWGLIEEDSKLINLIQKEFAETRYKFMLDLEGEYDFDEALKLGQIMDENLFIWLEAPIDESLLEQYRDLRSRIKIPITADGFNMYSSDFIKQGIEIGSWDAGRFDATTIGGISKALELLIISNDANLPIEIQSWGHSLAQATNLHLIFANERTRYFEIPMPKEAYEFGMKNGILFKDGEVYATMDHGLGINVDWDKLSTADYYIKTRG
jgi:L-alanine-DL-glutamate epimerase-like enolase superfamily enzyme